MFHARAGLRRRLGDMPGKVGGGIPRPGTASTSAGASEATLIRCMLRWRPTRRWPAARCRGAEGSGRLAAPARRCCCSGVGRRCGSCRTRSRGLVGRGAACAAAAGRTAPTPGSDQSRSCIVMLSRLMRPSFCDVRTEKSDVLAIRKFTGMLMRLLASVRARHAPVDRDQRGFLLVREAAVGLDRLLDGRQPPVRRWRVSVTVVKQAGVGEQRLRRDVECL